MLIDFLKTSTTKEDLQTTLKVLLEFKAGETDQELLRIPLQSWNCLEWLEEYLDFLVNDKPLNPATLKELERLQNEEN